jgi:hypothetical protein
MTRDRGLDDVQPARAENKRGHRWNPPARAGDLH